MPILHVRNVPEDLYERIRRRASSEKRSLSAEVIGLLEAGLAAQPSSAELDDYLRRLDEFRERTRGMWGSVDAVEDIREDRESH
jgi:plasmid stability protein